MTISAPETPLPAQPAPRGPRWGMIFAWVGVIVLLLLVYAGAVAVNLLRGRVHIACGGGLGGAQHGAARRS